jgi:hypothetical protein
MCTAVLFWFKILVTVVKCGRVATIKLGQTSAAEVQYVACRFSDRQSSIVSYGGGRL